MYSNISNVRVQEQVRKISRNENRKKYEENRRRAKGILPRKKFTNEEEKKLFYKEYSKKWYKENIERVKKNSRSWYVEHLEKAKENKKNYQKLKLKTDINYKLAYNLRIRLNKALNGNPKVGSAVKDAGCSISKLRAHLEKQFKPGMSWKNHGFYGWHIDHIIPLSSFNLSNRKELLEACHYTNLQPLWAEENLRKNKRELK